MAPSCAVSLRKQENGHRPFSYSWLVPAETSPAPLGEAENCAMENHLLCDSQQGQRVFAPKALCISDYKQKVKTTIIGEQ